MEEERLEREQEAEAEESFEEVEELTEDEEEVDTDESDEDIEEDDFETDDGDDDLTDETEEEESEEEESEEEEADEEETEDKTEHTEAEEKEPPKEEEHKETEIERKVKKLLEKNGLDVQNLGEGVDTLIAEMEGKTLEEYRAAEESDNKQKQMSAEEARKLIEADIAELKAEYPDVEITDIRKIPNFDKFAQFRDKGLNAKQAFAAANPDLLRESGAKAAKQTANNKAHLRSDVPSGGEEKGSISASELKRLMEMTGFDAKTVKKYYKKLKQ